MVITLTHFYINLLQEWDSILKGVDKAMKNKNSTNEKVLKELESKLAETRKWLDKELNLPNELAARSELQATGRPQNNLPIRVEKVNY